jgi:hypothetical protein
MDIMTDHENPAMTGEDAALPTRSGFVALIGPTNAGKSTLVNRLVGAKVSIVSHKVQTTRAVMRGIAIHDNAQIVFMDTPGIFKPPQAEVTMARSSRRREGCRSHPAADRQRTWSERRRGNHPRRSEGCSAEENPLPQQDRPGEARRPSETRRRRQ